MYEPKRILPFTKSTNVRIIIATTVLTIAPLVVRPAAGQQPAPAIQDLLSSLTSAEREAILLLHQGAARAGRGEWDRARDAFEGAIRRKPSALAYYNLGVTLAALGDSDRAIRAYKDAVRFDPQLTVARVNIGVELSKAGRPAAAVTYLEPAARAAPQMLVAHLNLGVVLSQLGRLDASIASLMRAFALDPNDTVVRRALVDTHYNYGVYFERRQLWEQAIEHHRAALVFDRSFADSFNGIGAALLHLHDREAALQMFDEAIHLRPSFNEARYNRAVAYVGLARYADAIQSCREILAGKPEFAPARTLLNSLENGSTVARLIADASLPSELIPVGTVSRSNK